MWRNWAGNQVATPSAVLRPRDVGELSAAVRSAAERGQRVKPIGSGHSFTGIGRPEGVQLDLSHLTGPISVDRTSGLVTVPAGMPLHRLNRLLELSGLAMPNLGDIDRQTIAGAISTGTHGTGATWHGLAAQVRALELVRADGTVLRVDAQHEPALFDCARVGLGALGVLSSVTLACVPAFTLHAAERPMPLQRVLAQLDELVAGNEHFEFFWFPHTDATLTKRNNRVTDGRVAEPLGGLRHLIDDELIGNGAFRLACELGRAAPTLVPRINRYAARCMGDREYSDASHRVFCSPRRVRFVEMEYAVPRHAVRAAIQGVRRVCDQPGMRVSFPVEVRFAAADDIPLSTANDRDSAYIAVHMFAGQPYRSYFAKVESVMAELAGRPHWGKMHGCDADTLRSRYPRFDDFRAVRDQVDPDRVFGNAYLTRVLGE